MSKIHVIDVAENVDGQGIQHHDINFPNEIVDDEFDALYQAIYGWIHGSNLDCQTITNDDIYEGLLAGTVEVTNIEHCEDSEDHKAYLLLPNDGCACVYDTIHTKISNDIIDYTAIICFFEYLVNNGYASTTVWDMTNVVMAEGGDLEGIALRAFYL